MNPKGLLLSGALMAALCVSAAPPAPKQNSEATVIGTERAIAIATVQAKAAPTAITKLVVKRDQDDTTQVETYEIELRANGIEFDYVIAAADGTIPPKNRRPKTPMTARRTKTRRTTTTIKHFSTSFPNQAQAPPRGLFVPARD